MNVYTLRFSDDGDGVAKRIVFKAEDLTTALIIAHREASRRTAELWCQHRDKSGPGTGLKWGQLG